MEVRSHLHQPIKSLRIERIGKANQLTGKIHVDQKKIAKNLMPKPVDMDALLKQNPQMELNTKK